jgi:hypothetical protein
MMAVEKAVWQFVIEMPMAGILGDKLLLLQILAVSQFLMQLQLVLLAAQLALLN